MVALKYARTQWAGGLELAEIQRSQPLNALARTSKLLASQSVRVSERWNRCCDLRRRGTNTTERFFFNFNGASVSPTKSTHQARKRAKINDCRAWTPESLICAYACFLNRGGGCAALLSAQHSEWTVHYLTPAKPLCLSESGLRPSPNGGSISIGLDPIYAYFAPYPPKLSAIRKAKADGRR